MLKTILVPTDGSDHAVKAIAIGSDLATRYGARMVLLHVLGEDDVPEELARFAEIEGLQKSRQSPRVEQPQAAPHGLAAVPTARAEDVDRRAVMNQISEKVLADAKSVARSHGLEAVDAVTAEGDPAEKILETARREAAEGIVMGSRGLSDLKGAFVGSVSHKVCHQADCTCITVT